jgi:hypothetical protein
MMVNLFESTLCCYTLKARMNSQLLWDFLLTVVFHAAKKDLISMETVTRSSGVDYLLVRTTALTPDQPIVGTVKVLTAKAARVNSSFFSVAKSDVALFMLGEACKPTMHSTAVTIGNSR